MPVLDKEEDQSEIVSEITKEDMYTSQKMEPRELRHLLHTLQLGNMENRMF